MLIRTLLAAIAVFALAGSAFAVEGGDRTVYPAEFFAGFAPQTAHDMVRRLPGFAIDYGADLRGFGATGGNVLIDGRRPASKSGGLGEALSRIPAAQVKEIVVIKGATSAEAQGQAVIADVIRLPANGEGTWSLGVERAGDGSLNPRGQASVSLDAGGWAASFKLAAVWDRIPFLTTRRLSDGTGGLIATRRDTRPTTYREIFGSMEASRTLGEGTFRVTASASLWAFDLDLTSAIFQGREPGGAPDRIQSYLMQEGGYGGEIGADYTLKLGEAWTWTSVALVSSKTYRQDQFDETPPAPEGVIRLRERPLEALLSTQFSRAGAVFRPEFSAEIAYNRLSSRLAFEVAGIAGPSSFALVEELRGEVRAAFGWTLAENWTLDGALAAEMSQISVGGDAEATQTLFYLKPSATLAWQAAADLQLRLSVARTAGQLDFSDFAAASDSEAGTGTAGNPNLKPEQTTRAALAADWTFSGTGALSLEIFHEWRTDTIELIVTPGGHAIGNAGPAERWGLTGTLTLPLNDVLTGLQFKATYELLETRFTDPVDGRARALSNGNRGDPYLFLELRRDDADARMAYGVSYGDRFDRATYFPDLVDRTEIGPMWNAFIETTRFEGIKIRLEGRSLNTQRFHRSRIFHDPDRSGPIDRIETRDSRRGAFVRLTVSGSF